jgi:hypothetical protein
VTLELETDANGIVTFLPIINWAVTIVMDKTVGLAVDYYASAEDAAASRLSRIQLHLDPEPAQQLGRAMAQRGDMVLGSSGTART